LFVSTVAKIRPDRYITSGGDVKIVASKAIKFYKYPTALSRSSDAPMTSGQRTKWTFHVTRSSFNNCSCNRQTMSGDDKTENFVVLGRLERIDDRRRRGEHNNKQRLELTAITPFDSRSKEFRRALRAIKDPDACRGNAARQSTVVDAIVEHRRVIKPGRKAWRIGARKQQPEMTPEEHSGSDGRRAWKINKMLKKRAEKNRERKENTRLVGLKPDVLHRENNKRHHLQLPSPAPSPQQPQQKRRQQARGQTQVDEQGVMANRRDRIERRKPTGDRPLRKTSRRNNRNDGRRRDHAR
jgi:hypothetical protein